MADLKKNQINNILTVMVDKTDFVTVESALAAADINIRLYGVAQGVSTLASTITVTKAARSVLSGIFQITLEADETDSHDHYMLRLSSTGTVSCATQYIPLTMVDVTNSDIHSLVSDVDSQLLLTASTVESNYSLLSDTRSTMDSQFAVTSNYLSYLSNVTSDTLSTMNSQFAVVSNYLSNISDIVSGIDSGITVLSNFQSDIHSLVSDVHSLTSDMFSTMGSQFAVTSNYLSNASNYLSNISAIVSDVDSQLDLLDAAVVAQRGSTASTVANASQVEIDGIAHASQFNGHFIKVLGGSQVQELRLITETDFVNSRLTVYPAFNSRLLSGVDYVIFSGNPAQSHFHSDLRSLTSGVGGTALTTSDISDIASRVWGEAYATHSLAGSFGSLVSLMGDWTSDVYSLLSDTRSTMDSQFAVTSNYLSNASNYLSSISRISSDAHSAAVLNLTQINNTLSRVNLLDSDLIALRASTVSQVTSPSTIEINGIAHDDQFNGHFVKVRGGSQVQELRLITDTDATASQITVHPAFNSRLLSNVEVVILYGNPAQSVFHSDLRSLTSGVGGTALTVSDISDIASRVWGEAYATHSLAGSFGSLVSLIGDWVSDVDSQVNLLDSALVAQRGSTASTVANASQLEIDGIAHDDQFNGHFIRVLNGSQIQEVRLITDTDFTNSRLTVHPPFNSRLLSGVDYVIFAGNPAQSDFHSDLRSLTSGVGGGDASNIASVVWSERYSDYTTGSTFGSKVGALTAGGTLTVSDISDIASRVWSEKYNTHSLASSFGSLFEVMASTVSDTNSLLSDTRSTMDSQFAVTSNYLSNASNYLSNISVLLSDVESAVDQIGTASNIASQVWTQPYSNYTTASQFGSKVGALTNDVSDFASAVWGEKYAVHSAASTFGSLVSLMGDWISDLDSQLNLTDSALVAQRGSTASQVGNASQIEIDGIAHDDQFNGHYIRVLDGSQIQELRLITDTDFTNSRLTVHPAFNSRLVSGVNYVIFSGNPAQSVFHSDLRSLTSGVGGTALTVSDISDIASRVWGEAYSAHSIAGSFGSLVSLVGDWVSDTYSLVSDVDSALTVMSGIVSNTYSLLSDTRSTMDSQFAVTSNYLSNASNYLSNISALVSDVDSQLNLLDSALVAQRGSTASTVANASQVEIDGIAHDDQFNGHYIRVLGGSQIQELRLITDTDFTNSRLTVHPPFNSRLLSGVDYVIFSGNPAQSDFHSDLRSLTSGVGGGTPSGVASAVWAELYTPYTTSSSFGSKLAGLTGGGVLTVSDISDIASRVWSEKYARHSLVSSFGSLFSMVGDWVSDTHSLVSDVDSALTVMSGVVSDTYSLLSDTRSTMDSQFAVTSNYLSNASNYLSNISAAVSDIDSQLTLTDSQVTANFDLISDVDSQLTETHNLLSDVESAVDQIGTASNVASAVWDEVLTGGTYNINNSAGKRLRLIDTAFEVHSGTAQAGSTSTTFVMDTGADGTNDDIYRGDRIVITAGTGVGEHGIITTYNASTRTATISESWVVTPDDTSEFVVVPADTDIETWNHNAVTGDGDWSDLDSKVTGIDSQLTLTHDLVSDVESQLDATHNLVSDVESQLDITASKVVLVEADVTTITNDLPATYTKGIAVTGFMFPMFNSSSPNTLKTGLTGFTAEISKDGGAFAAITPGTVTEVSDGWYKVDLSATEMNADEIALRFVASGGLEQVMKIVTQPT